MERERLLSRLEEESPELAAKIRSDMEEKRAGMRMMKRQNARRSKLIINIIINIYYEY